MTAGMAERPRRRVWEDESFDAELSWRRPSGIFIITELADPLRERIHEIQRTYDPKLARTNVPHLTLVGSSGVGPIAATTAVAQLREALEPITSSTPPLTLHFGPPLQFMQTNIVVLPLDPHGPLRSLHERIRASGLEFGRARFSFTPHVTLSFYKTLTAAERREILAIRVPDPVRIDTLQCSLTRDPLPPVKLLELKLEGRERD